MSKFVVFAKSRRFASLPLPLLAACIVIYISDLGLMDVPFLSGVATVPILIMSFISGAFFTPHFSSPNQELDATLPTLQMRVLRGSWLIAAVLIILSLEAIILRFIIAPGFTTLVIRNQILGLFLTLLVQVFVSARLAGLPALVIGLFIWFAGTSDYEATSRSWAIIMYLNNDVNTILPLAILGMTASIAYILYDGRELH